MVFGHRSIHDEIDRALGLIVGALNNRSVTVSPRFSTVDGDRIALVRARCRSRCSHGTNSGRQARARRTPCAAPARTASSMPAKAASTRVGAEALDDLLHAAPAEPDRRHDRARCRRGPCRGSACCARRCGSARRSSTPSRSTRDGGTTMPSWNTSVAAGEIEPGTMPPMSQRCPQASAKATSRAVGEHRRDEHHVVVVRDARRASRRSRCRDRGRRAACSSRG